MEAEKFKEINELQSRFFTNITHEFRTPLTVIQGITKQLKGNFKERQVITKKHKPIIGLNQSIVGFGNVGVK